MNVSTRSPASSWDDLVTREDLLDHLRRLIAAEKNPLDAPLRHDLLPPIGSQEVWAAGVTYYRSRNARMEESKSAGGGDFYDRVYQRDAAGAVLQVDAASRGGTGGKVAIRDDAPGRCRSLSWLCSSRPSGKIAGYTIGNDMSSRDIEGENPLYLPQAKVYDRSCALGPCLLIADEPLAG